MTRRVLPPPIVLVMDGNEDATMREQHAAATKVQSTQRGRTERRRFTRRRKTDRDEKAAAATKVQSTQRGRKERQKFLQRRDAERKRQKCLPPFVNLYVEAADGVGSIGQPRGRKVDASALSQFSGRYDRVDEVDGAKVKGAKVSHYVVSSHAREPPTTLSSAFVSGCACALSLPAVPAPPLSLSLPLSRPAAAYFAPQHRDVSAHLYQSTAGLWVLSSVFAPGCTVANAFCHHPKPERAIPDEGEEKSPVKPRQTRAEALAVAGAPLGPHQWHFYSPPKRAELSPDGSFTPTMRSSRGTCTSSLPLLVIYLVLFL